jgi:predicted enzyme related to lactoylglutathione lyase
MLQDNSMTTAVLNVTFDCADARRVAAFWSAVTGYEIERVDMPGNEFWLVSAPDGQFPRLVFVTVPERKAVKNRVHLDLLPAEGEQANEIERFRALGATIVDDRRELEPGGWVVLADPEGNEFCLEHG